eukprot:2307677-Alexandrium_andersonii.AAC.1
MDPQRLCWRGLCQVRFLVLGQHFQLWGALLQSRRLRRRALPSTQAQLVEVEEGDHPVAALAQLEGPPV